ncbi:hypothetical protein ACFO4O_04415 [Glaciecola siphonariae]|uniref:Uncharacterized protein n=1 Tax=Glaciecola siphonariae TaxID=521012 RepID=A0ABV9LSG1_9ALTE
MKELSHLEEFATLVQTRPETIFLEPNGATIDLQIHTTGESWRTFKSYTENDLVEFKLSNSLKVRASFSDSGAAAKAFITNGQYK